MAPVQGARGAVEICAPSIVQNSLRGPRSCTHKFPPATRKHKNYRSVDRLYLTICHYQRYFLQEIRRLTKFAAKYDDLHKAFNDFSKIYNDFIYLWKEIDASDDNKERAPTRLEQAKEDQKVGARMSVWRKGNRVYYLTNTKII